MYKYTDLSPNQESPLSWADYSIRNERIVKDTAASPGR